MEKINDKPTLVEFEKEWAEINEKIDNLFNEMANLDKIRNQPVSIFKSLFKMFVLQDCNNKELKIQTEIRRLQLRQRKMIAKGIK